MTIFDVQLPFRNFAGYVFILSEQYAEDAGSNKDKADNDIHPSLHGIDTGTQGWHRHYTIGEHTGHDHHGKGCGHGKDCGKKITGIGTGGHGYQHTEINDGTLRTEGKSKQNA